MVLNITGFGAKTQDEFLQALFARLQWDIFVQSLLWKKFMFKAHLENWRSCDVCIFLEGNSVVKSKGENECC